MTFGALTRDGLSRLLALLCGFAFALPYLVMFFSSFRPSSSISADPLNIFAGDWSFSNYAAVTEDNDVLMFYVNSAIVTTAIVALQVVTSVLAAFSLGHLAPPGKTVFRWVIIAMLSIPLPAIVIANYLTIDRAGLFDTRLGLVLPFAASAFGIFLLTHYVESIPRGQLDAAKLLGLSVWERFWRLVLPHIRPAVLAFTAFIFVGYWNEFFWPLIVIRNPDLATIPFAIREYVNADPSGVPDWGPMMAAGTLALLPLSLLLILVQRSFSRTLAFN